MKSPVLADEKHEKNIHWTKSRMRRAPVLGTVPRAPHSRGEQDGNVQQDGMVFAIFWEKKKHRMWKQIRDMVNPVIWGMQAKTRKTTNKTWDCLGKSSSQMDINQPEFRCNKILFEQNGDKYSDTTNTGKLGSLW